MAKKKEIKRDSIFDATNEKKTPKKTARPAKNPVGSGEDCTLRFKRYKVLNTLLMGHEAEVIYRKGKEDRLLVMGLGLVAAIAIGAFLIRATGAQGTGWFYSLIFRTLFAVLTGLAGFTAAAMMELNRTRLQDLLSMIVKIQESFGLFVDGAYSEDGGAYLPNTYKFVGSINDDETNYAVLVLKLGSVITAIGVFLLV